MNNSRSATLVLVLVTELALVYTLTSCLDSSAVQAQKTDFLSPALQARSSAETIQASAANTVEVWLTNGNNKDVRLQQQPTITFTQGPASNPLQIQVTEIVTYQQMDGFGAALTDSAAWVITNTPDITRTKVLSDLFSPTEGIGISYIRLPMGASDFVTGTHYTYDDLPAGMTDTQLISFSIGHDQAYIIPILQQAKSLNPQLKVMASPWSAPAWMKSPETLYGGCLNLEYCQVYANYFVKFIQAYEAEGIPIHAVTVQNEPYYPETCTMTTTYPAMHMEPSEQAYFVKNCLGQAFDTANITDTKILTWDHNWDGWAYPLAVLSDTAARGYIAGSAWHCYSWPEAGPEKQSLVHNAYPDKDIYFTECTGRLGTDFGDDLVWNFRDLFMGTMRHWAKTVLLWNLALDENGEPHQGGCEGCRGVVTINQTGVVTYNVEYYAIGHFSKFVDPGAYRIQSVHCSGQLESVAFQNPDSSIVLVVLNPDETTEKKVFDVLWNGHHFSYPLPGKSVATFKWNPFDWVTHTVYLPIVLKAYRPSSSFQDFEPANGTPGDTCEPVWFAECSFESTIVHDGSRSVLVHTHADANSDDPDYHGGTVHINPSSSSPVDLSPATTISVWVYDTQDDNTVELKLCGNPNHCSDPVWSTMPACRDTWTEITWPLSAFTGIDKSQITHIELYEYRDGIYYFDNISWR